MPIRTSSTMPMPLSTEKERVAARAVRRARLRRRACRSGVARRKLLRLHKGLGPLSRRRDKLRHGRVIVLVREIRLQIVAHQASEHAHREILLEFLGRRDPVIRVVYREHQKQAVPRIAAEVPRLDDPAPHTPCARRRFRWSPASGSSSSRRSPPRKLSLSALQALTTELSVSSLSTFGRVVDVEVLRPRRHRPPTLGSGVAVASAPPSPASSASAGTPPMANTSMKASRSDRIRRPLKAFLFCTVWCCIVSPTLILFALNLFY